jgi:molybdopterin/thiamine biosynthesis adenylyltransferase
MNADQQRENQRMLAAVLGLPDEEASARLTTPLQVTWDLSDPVTSQLGEMIVHLLVRTFGSVGKPNMPVLNARCEVIINGALPKTESAAAVFVRINQYGCRISRNPIAECIETQPSDIPKILLLLCSCYCAALAVETAVGMPPGWVGPDGIDIDFAHLLGVPLSDLTQQVDLGNCHMAGAGAVGNAFLYALQYLPIKGRLVIIDPKNVTGGIINRCLWFTEDDIGQPKAERLASKAKGLLGQVEIDFFNGTVDDHRAEINCEYECLIVGIDSRRGRRALQEQLPREVFDASTTGIEEVVFHHNVQLSEKACLACIYSETDAERGFEKHVAETLGVSTVEVVQGFITPAAAKRIASKYPHLDPQTIVGTAFDSLFRQLCSTQQLVTTEQRQVLAPFAFVSQLGGTILAIELFLRRQNPARSATFNYWRVSPWRNINIDMQQILLPHKNCPVCSDTAYQSVARELWMR